MEKVVVSAKTSTRLQVDYYRFGDVLALQQVVRGLQVVGTDGGPFEHGRRRGPVVQSHHEQAHGTITCVRPAGDPVAGNGTGLAADLPAEPTSLPRRASWNDRICSSTARSTLRISTSSGATTGHRRREVEDAVGTPAATNRSADVLCRRKPGWR